MGWKPKCDWPYWVHVVTGWRPGGRPGNILKGLEIHGVGRVGIQWNTRPEGMYIGTGGKPGSRW